MTIRRVQVGGLVLLVAAAAFVGLFRLATPSWHGDEVAYRNAGAAYLHGDFRRNQEHPPLAKYVFGTVERFAGTGPGAARLPSALASLLTGTVLFAFGTRISGRASGVVAFALWTLLPHAIRSPEGEVVWLRMDRMALLEPLLVLFTMVTLYLGWRWAETGSWRWAAGAGAALGAAVAVKVPGILVLPALGIAGIALGVRAHQWGRVVAQGLVLLGAAAAVAALTYLPFGTDAPAAVRYMFEFQGRHASNGHIVLVRGKVYAHPPWWAHLWWEAQSLGRLPFLSMGLAVVAALILSRRVEVMVAATAAAVPALYFAFWSNIGLAHYHHAWDAPLTLLAAIGIVALARRPQLVTRALVAVLGAVLLGAATWTVWQTAHLRPQGYSAATAVIRRELGERPLVLVRGDVAVLHAYLPLANVSRDLTHFAPDDIDAVILDKGFTSRFADPAVDAIVAARGVTAHDEGAGVTVYLLHTGHRLDRVPANPDSRIMKTADGSSHYCHNAHPASAATVPSVAADARHVLAAGRLGLRKGGTDG